MGIDIAGSDRGTVAQGLADIVHGDPFGAGNAVVETLSRISEPKE